MTRPTLPQPPDAWAYGPPGILPDATIDERRRAGGRPRTAMSMPVGDRPWLQHLARRLEHDIRRRGLGEGARYLTAAEAADLLGVSTTTAHRALTLLTQRGMLVRIRGRGTFIARGAGRPDETSMPIVCVLLPAEGPETHQLRFDLLVREVRRRFESVRVELIFLREGETGPYLDRLFTFAHTSELVGIIAVSCFPEVYRYLVRTGVPAVVLGSPYPGEPCPPSIDGDHRAAGRLLADYLLGRGHRRIALLLPEANRPGQAQFVQGAHDSLGKSEGRGARLRVYGVHHEEPEFTQSIAELISRPDRPTALVVRRAVFAEKALGVAMERGLRVPDDVEITFREPSFRVDWSAFARTQPQWDFDKVAARIAAMLNGVARGASPAEGHTVVPMELRKPDVPRTK